MAQKLYFSHLSIPLVLPNITNPSKSVMQWWAYRGMRYDPDFAEKPGHVVAFLRVTELPIPKAELLNRLLFDKSHDVFYNRELDKRNRSSRIMSDGLVEIGTYRPPKCPCESAD